MWSLCHPWTQRVTWRNVFWWFEFGAWIKNLLSPSTDSPARGNLTDVGYGSSEYRMARWFDRGCGNWQCVSHSVCTLCTFFYPRFPSNRSTRHGLRCVHTFISIHSHINPRTFTSISFFHYLFPDNTKINQDQLKVRTVIIHIEHIKLLIPKVFALSAKNNNKCRQKRSIWKKSLPKPTPKKLLQKLPQRPQRLKPQHLLLSQSQQKKIWHHSPVQIKYVWIEKRDFFPLESFLVTHHNTVNISPIFTLLILPLSPHISPHCFTILNPPTIPTQHHRHCVTHTWHPKQPPHMPDQHRGAPDLHNIPPCLYRSSLIYSTS